MTKGEQAEVKNLLNSLAMRVLDAGLNPDELIPVLLPESSLDPKRGIRNLLRYLETGYGASFLRDLNSHPVTRSLVMRIFSHSQFLSDIIIRDVGVLEWLVYSDELQREKERAWYVTVSWDDLSKFNSIEKKMNALRRFQRREMLRLGVMEIFGLADQRSIMRQVSWLADGVLESVLKLAHEEKEAKEQIAIPRSISIIGLGKLGGEELNFSSDIDIMFVLKKERKVRTVVDAKISLHTLATSITKRVVELVTSSGAGDHLYRLDLRLRPDGKSGPLVLPISDFRSYYESRGALWERQMLLKARHVAGDASAGKEFLSKVKPFIHPKTRLDSPLQEIAAIKGEIERTSSRQNIKLAAGGIRDIEFICQALQLVDGSVLERGTLAALTTLTEKGILKQREHASLKKAYLFLRRIEHQLQLLEGLQAHTLPESGKEFEALSARMGFKDGESLRSMLEKHRKQVRSIYDKVFISGSPHQKLGLKSLGIDPITSIEKETMSRIQSFIPFADLKLLGKEINRLKLEDSHREQVLKSVELLASAQSTRRMLEGCFGSVGCRKFILDLVTYSTEAARIFSMDPLFFESLIALGPRDSVKDPWEFLLKIDPAKHLKYHSDRTTLLSIAGLLSMGKSSRVFSHLIEAIINDVWTDCLDRLHLPADGIGLAAYGGFSAKTLTPGADLDLVCIFDAAQGVTPEKADECIRFLRSALDEKGYPLVLDLRLRPEGASAPLGTEISFYERYVDERAEPWEMLALHRSRVITQTSSKIKSRFRLLRSRSLKQFFSIPRKEYLIRMREKMVRERVKKAAKVVELKLSHGGLTDIEWTLQLLSMKTGNDSWERGISALRRSRKSFPGVSMKETLVLLRNLDYFYSLLFFIRHNAGGDAVGYTEGSLLESMLAKKFGNRNKIQFSRELKMLMQWNHSIFLRVLNALW